MDMRSASLTLSAAAIALGLVALFPGWASPSDAAHQMTVAQSEDTMPANPPAPDPKTLTNPDANTAVTPDEVAECMKSWDPQSGMSKAEYEQSCKSTLRYFPERP